MTVNRQIALSATALSSFNAALAWLVGAYDREFTQAEDVNVTVRKVVVTEADDRVRYLWEVTITGDLEDQPAQPAPVAEEAEGR